MHSGRYLCKLYLKRKGSGEMGRRIKYAGRYAGQRLPRRITAMLAAVIVMGIGVSLYRAQQNENPLPVVAHHQRFHLCGRGICLRVHSGCGYAHHGLWHGAAAAFV